MNKKVLLIATTVIVLLFFVTAGCSSPNRGTGGQKNTDHLKIGIFPISDILPLVVGKENGYFTAEGINLELVPFQSAVEKESAFQAGRLDGVITDMVVACLMRDTGTPAVITSLTLGAAPGEGRFGIAAAPNSGIRTLEDLKGKKVGISTNTMIEYILDGLLYQAGLGEDYVEKVSVPKIPVRMEMLMEGKIDAAIFPDPLLTLAEHQGAPLVADDTWGENLSQVVLVFNDNLVSGNPELLQRFYRGYARAVDAINSSPDNYRELFVRETNVPEVIKDIYDVPVFPGPTLPAPEDIRRVVDWLLGKKLITKPISYEDLTAHGIY